MFKETEAGQTHFQNDRCGEREHNCDCGYTEARGKPCKFCPPKSSTKLKKCTCPFLLDTAREIGHSLDCPRKDEKTWWQKEDTKKELEEIINKVNLDATGSIYDTLEAMRIYELDINEAYQQILEAIVFDVLKIKKK